TARRGRASLAATLAAEGGRSAFRREGGDARPRRLDSTTPIWSVPRVRLLRTYLGRGSHTAWPSPHSGPSAGLLTSSACRSHKGAAHGTLAGSAPGGRGRRQWLGCRPGGAIFNPARLRPA